MGFWHTGYFEFHEPTGLGLSVPRQPPLFICDRCDESFSSADARGDHRFEAHPQHKPVLIVQGRELGARRLRITRTLFPSDVRLDCDRAWLNDGEIPAYELGDALADRDTPDVCRIRLRKDGIDTGFELEFRIASDEDLTYVESRFEEIIRRGRLDSRVVDDFIGTKSEFGTAISYCDGICAYLYGILAREQRPGSALAHNLYERKFNNAAETLTGYERPLARTIGSLIEFHFNHFGESAALAPESRVGGISERFLHWIRSNRSVRPSGEEKCPATPAKDRAPAKGALDRLLTDAVTEEIMCWSMRPLPELADDADDIEARLTNDLRVYDQVKLRVLLGEFHAAYGETGRALTHAQSLRNTPSFEAWAEKLLASLQR